MDRPNTGARIKNKSVSIVRRGSGEVMLQSIRWCSSHLCRLIGLQFRPGLKPGEGLVLVHANDSKSASSIHMFFVFFPIAAVWINSQGKVTSAQLAKPWRPYYGSPEPARYVVETTPEFLEQIKVGDFVDFV